MLYHYDKKPKACSIDDLHFFTKMRHGMNQNTVWIRRVTIGDAIIFHNEHLVRWKIVKVRNGHLFLGYITTKDIYSFKDYYSVYVVAPGLDSKNPFIALHRIDHFVKDFLKLKG